LRGILDPRYRAPDRRDKNMVAKLVVDVGHAYAAVCDRDRGLSARDVRFLPAGMRERRLWVDAVEKVAESTDFCGDCKMGHRASTLCG
jgi:hypothetical protein